MLIVVRTTDGRARPPIAGQCGSLMLGAFKLLLLSLRTPAGPRLSAAWPTSHPAPNYRASLGRASSSARRDSNRHSAHHPLPHAPRFPPSRLVQHLPSRTADSRPGQLIGQVSNKPKRWRKFGGGDSLSELHLLADVRFRQLRGEKQSLDTALTSGPNNARPVRVRRAARRMAPLRFSARAVVLGDRAAAENCGSRDGGRRSFRIALQ
jgi:hypothetical protein